ncbi:MAG: carbohydrate porin [Tepidisphaeraceae bacterium]|jgi:high affinity Mn2+ porin
MIFSTRPQQAESAKLFVRRSSRFQMKAPARALLFAVLMMVSPSALAAADAIGPATQPAAPDVPWFNVHAQATVITQWHDVFPAPYTGPNSLQPHEGAKTSVTATLFTGLRMPWDGGAFYFDPEVAGGEGLSGVTGIASFPNGDISHVGAPQPEPYVARAYYQQVFGLGGEKERVDSDQNQLAGDRDVRRITVWLGGFSATDFFDNNTYSHDPRTQFMNESFMDDTAWDYPADTRGYTIGGVIELNEPSWAIRYGVFQEPHTANGETLDPHVLKSLGHALELEERWSIKDQPGVVRLLGYANVAHMGSYRQALANPGPNGPDITLSRTYSVKYGFSVSAEQAITSDLGIWGRAGWNDGQTESWAFTEVDDLGSLGISLKGTHWERPDDVFGFAGAIAGLSDAHKDYLAAGGLGFIIGDGKLNYAPEEVLETYYNCKIVDHVFVTPDLQFVEHPAYNSDRGPVFIAGVRAHVEF